MGCCFGVQRSDERYYVTVYLQEVFTATSGDVGQRHGDFYFKFGPERRWRYLHSRFPSKGFIKLSIGETFLPTPRFPLVYSEMLTLSHKKMITFKVHVWESDPLHDDMMMAATVEVPVTEIEGTNITELLDNDPKANPIGENGKPIPRKHQVTKGNDKKIKAHTGEPVEITSNDGKIKMKLIIEIEQRPEW